MTNIREDMRHKVNDCMRQGDKERLGVFRIVNSEIGKHEIDARKPITQEEFVQLLNRMRKQHQASMDQFQAAGRDDLYQKESAEKEIIETLLPKQLTSEEVAVFVDEAIKSSGAQGVQDMGKAMQAIKDKVFGKADMGEVSQLIKSKLTQG